MLSTFVENYCHALKSDVPAPLATKMFYSQRNHRLRSALTYLYYEASSKEHSGDFVNSKALQGNAVPLQDSSPKNSHEKINVQREKVCHFFFFSLLRQLSILHGHVVMDYYVHTNMDLGNCYPLFLDKIK